MTDEEKPGFGERLRDGAVHLRKHLVRTSGLAAALLALISIGLYALIRSLHLPTAIGDPAAQMALILASVAFGAWFLPDLRSKLWSLNAKEVRALIPPVKQDELNRALIDARSEHPEWNQLVWERALAPLLTASERPSTYIMNMQYAATVSTDRKAKVGGRTISAHSVMVEQRSHRVIGERDDLWISIARTPDALKREFGKAGCLGRELVPFADLVGTEWQSAVIDTGTASLTIGGLEVPLRAVPDQRDPDIVRWYAPDGYPPPEGWVEVLIGYTYRLDTDVETFPVMFTTYYCAGTTTISLKIDKRAGELLGCDEFVGRALEDRGQGEVITSDKGAFKEMRFSTGQDAILWPGSGVMFRWSPAP